MQKGFAMLAIVLAACGDESEELQSPVAGTRALGPTVEVMAAGRVTPARQQAVADKALVMLAVERRAGDGF